MRFLTAAFYVIACAISCNANGSEITNKAQQKWSQIYDNEYSAHPANQHGSSIRVPYMKVGFKLTQQLFGRVSFSMVDRKLAKRKGKQYISRPHQSLGYMAAHGLHFLPAVSAQSHQDLTPINHQNSGFFVFQDNRDIHQNQITSKSSAKRRKKYPKRLGALENPPVSPSTVQLITNLPLTSDDVRDGDVGWTGIVSTLNKSNETKRLQVKDTDSSVLRQRLITGKTSRKIDLGNDELTSIRRFINAWADAWSRRDELGYFSAYSTSFASNIHLSKDEWRRQRRKALQINNEVSVKIYDLHIAGTAAHPEINFWQVYRSNRLTSRIKKILVLERTQNGWRIVRETVVH